VTGSTETAALAPTASGSFKLVAGGPRLVVREAAAAAAGFTAALSWTQVMGWLDTFPAYSLAGAVGAGVLAATPRKLLWTPAVAGLALGGVFLAEVAGLPQLPLVGAGLGLGAAWLRSADRSRLDLLNGALAGVVAASVTAMAFWQGWLAFGQHWLIEFALLGVVAATILAPTLVRFQPRSEVPSKRRVELTLEERHRAPVFRAVELYGQLKVARPDEETMMGLEEVVSWVYRLAQSQQTLTRELDNVDVQDLSDRIELLMMEAEESEDEFTQDRQLATAAHLEKLLQHAEQLGLEQRRCSSLQEYALAYLEEARMGLALARTLPGEATPGRLGEVLGKLRGHAREGDARRRTAREIQGLG
jgi:hypothetical protein